MWIDDLARLREQRTAAVLATVIAVRGHTPREAGAKFVVSAQAAYGSIGGGNLEMLAIDKARDMLSAGATASEQLVLRLNDRVPAVHGRQCCGGEVTVLLEPVGVPPTIAVFGLGHVGLELALILARHEVDLVLCDSRREQLAELDRLVSPGSPARIQHRHAVFGEQVLAALPAGAMVLIMTHDHAEDFHLCAAALEHGRLGYIGLIGSAAKFSRFKSRLADSGYGPERIDSITCPIGLPGLSGKQPALIAVSVAADLLQSTCPTRRQPSGDSQAQRSVEAERPGAA